MKNYRSLKIVIMCLTAILTATSGQAQDQSLPPLSPLLSQIVDIAGVYECHGINPNGKPYEGIVEIAKNGDTYRLRWVINDNDITLGLGFTRGDLLVVSYFGGAVGVVLYQIDPSGSSLVGGWIALGAEGQVYSETLTKLPEGSVVPKPALPPGHPTPRRRSPSRPNNRDV